MTEHGVQDRVVIVTGAGRGIGRGISVHLARHGARIVAAEYRQHRLDEVIAELNGLDVPNLGVECDVSDRESVFTAVEAAIARFGRIDAIVNNAQSFRPVMPLEDVTESDMDLLYRTGTLGTLWGMQAVYPHMRDAGYGRIVNVGSANGIRGAAGFGPYNASKEAIRALTRTAAREWARHGIVTNCYCPAAAGHRDAPPEGDLRADAWDAMYRNHPMQRDGDPEEDIAPVVLFLCSPAAQWLNGETLMLDGGGYMTAWIATVEHGVRVAGRSAGGVAVQVTFWGTRGSIAKAGPTTLRYGGNTSCVSVRTDGGTLLVLDGGTGIHELGQTLLREDGPVNGHLLIGHTHWDHIQGLPFFAPLFQAGNTWHVYGPRGLDSSIDKALAGQMQYTYFPVQLLDFDATIDYHDLVEGRFEIDDVVVTTRYLHHPALTLGYRIEADGVVVVYSSDHEPTIDPEPGPEDVEKLNREEAQHVAFLRDADLVIHDAQYLAVEYPDKVGWGHSPMEYAVDVACAADARRLALYHHDPTRTDDEVDALVAKARERAREVGYAGEVFGAAEGLTITLESAESEEPRGAIDTAMSTPALDDLPRAVLIALANRDADTALHDAARVEHFDTLRCADFDDALHTARAAQPPIVVLEAAPGRSIDDLADDAREIVESYPEGATVAYVTTTTPPANAIRPEITDWLVWPASQSHLRTKLRAWFLRRACRWQSAALPANESERLAALWDLGILDTEPDARFDRFTEVACSTFDVPMSLLTFVDEDRQWFKSHPGVPVSESHRDESMCAHAILGDDVFVISDTLQDDRFADNPNVARGARLRFYAGVPLTLADGHHVGTLCIMDHRPRVLDDDEIERLRQLGQMVEGELESYAEESTAE